MDDIITNVEKLDFADEEDPTDYDEDIEAGLVEALRLKDKNELQYATFYDNLRKTLDVVHTQEAPTRLTFRSEALFVRFFHSILDIIVKCGYDKNLVYTGFGVKKRYQNFRQGLCIVFYQFLLANRVHHAPQCTRLCEDFILLFGDLHTCFANLEELEDEILIHSFYNLYDYYHSKEQLLTTNCIYLELPKDQIGPVLRSISFLMFALIRGFGICLSMEVHNKLMTFASAQAYSSDTILRMNALRILTVCLKKRPQNLDSPTTYKVLLSIIRLLLNNYENNDAGDEVFRTFLDTAFSKFGDDLCQVLSAQILEALGKTLTQFRRLRPSRKTVGALFVRIFNLCNKKMSAQDALEKYLKPLHDWLDTKDFAINTQEEFDLSFHMVDLMLLIHPILSQDVIIERINIWLQKVVQVSESDERLKELFIRLRETKLENVLWGIEKSLLNLNEYLKAKNTEVKKIYPAHEEFIHLLSVFTWKSGADLKAIFHSAFSRCTGVQHLPNFAALNLSNGTGRKGYIEKLLGLIKTAFSSPTFFDADYKPGLRQNLLRCWIDLCWLWCHPHYNPAYQDLPECFHTDVERKDLIQRRIYFHQFVDPIVSVINAIIDESDPGYHCAKIRMSFPQTWCRLMRLAENMRLKQNKTQLHGHLKKFLSVEPKELRMEFANHIHLIANKAYLKGEDDEEGLFYIIFGSRFTKRLPTRHENVRKALSFLFDDWEDELNDNQDEDIFVHLVASMATVSFGVARVHCLSILIRTYVNNDDDWELLTDIKERTQYVAQECGFKDSQELFDEHQRDLYEWVISVCIDWPDTAFFRIAAAFYNHQSETIFLEGLIQTILDSFDTDQEQKYMVLQKICGRLNKVPSAVIQPHLNKIITGLLFRSIEEERPASECLQQFINMVDLSKTPDQLITENVRPIIFQLVFYLGNGRTEQVVNGRRVMGEQEKAKAALEIVRKTVHESEVQWEETASTDYGTFLAGYTQQLLDRYASILLTDSEEAQKRRAIRSTKALIATIGPRCGKYAAKIMTLLKKCSELESLQARTMDLWKVFVEALDSDSLATYMAQITVIILEYLRPEREHQSWSATQMDFEEEVEISDTDSNDGSNYGMSASLTQFHHTEPQEDTTPNRVVEILEYMICDNIEFTKCNFDQLPMFPDDEELETIQNTVEGYLGRPSFEKKIKQLSKVLEHESEQVKKAAVKSLLGLINSDRKEFSKWLDDSRFEGKIRGILLNLFRLTKSKDKEMTLLLSELLGEIGAINLNVTSDIVASHKSYHEITNLIITILNRFLKGAVESAPDTRIQKKVQYVIQELLKLLECTERSVTRRGTNGFDNWRRLRGGWNVFEPCLRSSYQANEHQTKRRKLKRLSNIFAQHKWQSEWFHKLVSLSGNCPKKPVYEVCSLLTYSHPHLAEFLLPDLVLDVIQNDHDSMIHEVSVIFQNLSHDGSTQLSASGAHRSCQLTREKEAQCQIVLKIIDVLNHWKVGGDLTKKVTSDVKTFLESLDLPTMAEAALKCHSYTRAFQYQERHIQSKEQLNTGPNVKDIALYQNIVAKLREFSFLDIVSNWVSGYDTQLNALTYKFQGKWIDSMNCYYSLVDNNTGGIENHEGLLDCYLRVGQYVPIVNHVSMKDDPRLNGYAMKACWRLYRWDDLDEYCKEKEETEVSLDVRFGRCMSALQKGKQSDFDVRLEDCQISVMKSLSVACMESYERTYPYLVELHCLHELKCAAKLIFNEDVTDLSMGKEAGKDTNAFFWKERLRRTQDSFEVKENILSVRRAIFKLAKLTEDEAGSWLNLMNEALEKEQTQMASFAFMKCKGSNTRSDRFQLNLDVAGAKLEFMRGNVQKAISNLQVILKSKSRAMEPNQLIEYHQLYAGWLQQSGIVSKDIIEKELKSICKLAGGKPTVQEDSYFQYATFLDQMCISTANTIISTTGTSNEKEIFRFEGHRIPRTKYEQNIASSLKMAINCYAFSITKGNQHVFQSLPRMLKLHFEYGNTLDKTEPPTQKKRRSSNGKKGSHLEKLKTTLKSVPAYSILTAVSQIVARAIDRRAHVQEIVDFLIQKIFKSYPNESIWKLAMFILGKKGNDQDRKYACERIGKLLKKEKAKVFSQAQKLMQALDDYLIASNQKKSTAQKWEKVKKYKDLDLVLPIQSQIDPCLPKTGVNKDEDTYVPFSSAIKIQGFIERPKVMASLARPSRVKVRGNDGKKYLFLLKVEDTGDLRKEGRVMDLCSLVNRILQSNSDAKRRNLQIRTFSVVTWRGKAGMLEWMENTCTLRDVLRESYGSQKSFDKLTQQYGHKLHTLQKPYLNGSTEQKKKLTAEFVKMDEEFPRFMKKWFNSRWPDCEHWFRTRLLFTTSLAVWSMVGMILGLGDRHTENILMDEKSGQICHVDFDCIFDKATTLNVPEQVPFRLTRSLRTSLGVCDYSGPFRETCVITLTALRKEKNSLKTVLDAFINDPLSHEDPEDLAEKLASASQRLEGFVPTKNFKADKEKTPSKIPKIDPTSSPLSPEGQTDSLIQLAVDPELLSKMFRGWMPFV